MSSDDDIKQILLDNPYYIFNIENPSDELISTALEAQDERYLHVMINLIPKFDQEKFWNKLPSRPTMMQLIKNKSSWLQYSMVSQFPENIFTFDNPCKEAQIAVAHKRPELISYLKNPCFEASNIANGKLLFSNLIKYIFLFISMIISWFFPLDQLETIRKYPEFIRQIEHPTTKQQLAAVQSNPYCIIYIKNPSNKVQNYMYNNHRDICRCMMQNINVRMQYNYVSSNPLWISYIKNPNGHVEIKALLKCPELIYYVKNKMPKEVNLVLLKQNPKLIALMKNPTYEEELFALKQGLSFYDFVKPSSSIMMDMITLKSYTILQMNTPSIDMISHAVRIDSNLNILIDAASEKDKSDIIEKEPDMIRYITDPSESIQMKVFKKDPKYTLLIKNPTQEIKNCAIKHNSNYEIFFQNPDSEESQKILYQTFLKPLLPSDFVCAICLIDENDDAPNCQFPRKLRCGHTFHADCIRPWINNHFNCPACRALVI